MNFLVASWDDTGLMGFGVQFWKMENFTGFDLLGGTGCGEIDFWEAILKLSRRGNGFKMEH